MTSGGNNFQ